MPIPLAIPLAIGAGKAAVGLGQLLGAKKPPPRAPYEIPAEARQALAIQAGLAEQREFFQPEREELQATTAAQVGALKEAADTQALLGAVGQAYTGQTARQREYDIANLRERMRQQQQLQQALGTMADYREKAWELNVNIPWKRAMGEWAERRTAGFENLFAGLGDVAGTAMMGISGRQMEDFYRDLYGIGGRGMDTAGMGVPAGARTALGAGTTTTPQIEREAGETFRKLAPGTAWQQYTPMLTTPMGGGLPTWMPR